MFHTHTLPQEGGEIKVRTDEMKMRTKEMKVDENENEVKVTSPGCEEGNTKEEGKSKHQHKHTWPRAGKP